MQNSFLLDKVKNIFDLCRKHHLKIRTAESCTGGALAHLFTQIPGSSEFFDRGIVSYSNEAKHELLNIPTNLIKEYGAVSHKIATCMAESISGKSIISISTTGVLGPNSDEKKTEIGTVYIAVNIKQSLTLVKKHLFKGSRENNHLNTISSSISLACHALNYA